MNDVDRLSSKFLVNHTICVFECLVNRKVNVRAKHNSSNQKPDTLFISPVIECLKRTGRVENEAEWTGKAEVRQPINIPGRV